MTIQAYRDATGTVWVRNEVGTYGVPGGEARNWSIDLVAQMFGTLTPVEYP